MNLTKQISHGLVSQLRDLWKLLFLIYLPISLLFIGVGILSRAVDHVSLAFFLRDIVATGKLPFFAGFVSQLGALLWSASLTVCLFSLLLLPRHTDRLMPTRRFLFHAAILTAVLLLDDIFLFHEEIAPEYLHIPERIVIVLYLILGVVFVFANWREMLASDYLILGLSLALFGSSIFLDALPIEGFHVPYFWEQLEIFFEDGFKFAGIATWLTFFTRYGMQHVQGMNPHLANP